MDIKMIRQNRGATGAEASAEGADPLSSRLGVLGSVVSSPSQGRSQEFDLGVYVLTIVIAISKHMLMSHT